MRTLVALGLTLLVSWMVVWAWGNFTESGRIDACLDEGGAWHFEQSRCVLARSSP